MKFTFENKKESTPHLDNLRDVLNTYHEQNNLDVNLSDYKPDNLIAYSKKIHDDQGYWANQESKLYLYKGKKMTPEEMRSKIQYIYEGALLENEGIPISVD